MKNPWLSLWLSAANASAGAARSFRTAEMRRQQRAMVREMQRAAKPQPRKRAPRKKRAS